VQQQDPKEGLVNCKAPIPVIVALVASSALAGCSSVDSASERATRGSSAVEACRDHGGVSAFDDDAVICGDQTARDERGTRAVEACRRHGGVSAFDDDIVICRDQTFHEAAEG
jgi:hypothetical protein